METIFRRSSVLISAQVISKLVSFFYNVFLAGKLGAGGFGLYITALSYYSLFSALSDFGINKFLLREISQAKNNSSKLILSTITLRIISLSLIFLLFAAAVHIFDKNVTRADLAILAAMAVIPQGISLTLDAVLIAESKINRSAISLFMLGIITPLLGISLIELGFSVFGAILAIIFGQVSYVLLLIMLTSFERESILSSIDLSIFKGIFFESLPYGVLALMGLLYFKVDALILSYIKGSIATGIYGLAYRFLEASAFIPQTIAIILLPLMSNREINKYSRLAGSYFKAVILSFLLGTVLAAIYILFLPFIIKSFLPGYTQSIEVIKILALSMPFMFSYVVASALLLSSKNLLKQTIMIGGFCLLVNVLLNFIFIPQFSYYAASWITVFSDILSFVLIIAFIKYTFSSSFIK